MFIKPFKIIFNSWFSIHSNGSRKQFGYCLFKKLSSVPPHCTNFLVQRWVLLVLLFISTVFVFRDWLIILTLVSLLSFGLMFYQDHHGDILERARDALLTNAVIVLQRSMKRFLYRRKHHNQTCAAVIIQKSWKCYHEQRIYHKVWFENIFRSSQTSPLFFLS